MTLRPYMLTVLTTSRCTAACRHCNMNAGPDRDASERLDYRQMESTLLQAFEGLDLQLVVFAGGEPLLLGEALLEAIRLCTAHGCKTRVVTNGYWATTPGRARAVLGDLKRAGLFDINISTDDFHLPWVSLQRVRNAFQAASELEFVAPVVATCSGPRSWLLPAALSQDLSGGRMAWRFDDEGVSQLGRLGLDEIRWGILSNSRIQRIGRANHSPNDQGLTGQGLTGQGLTEEQTAGACDEVPPAAGCPWAVRSAAISAKHHLVACCGFEVEDNPILDYGDLDHEPLADLLARADADLVTNIIAYVGPFLVKRILERLCPDEVRFPRPSYATYCEVCEDLIGIAQNRRALYRRQGLLAEHVLGARERDRARQERRAAGEPGAQAHLGSCATRTSPNPSVNSEVGEPPAKPNS